MPIPSSRCKPSDWRARVRVFAQSVLAVLLIAAAFPSMAASPVGGYALGAGDRLRLTVFGEPDMSGEFTVRPTGTISLPLLGEVHAAGLTPQALEAKVTASLDASYLVNPRINVEVVAYRNFYVLGEVKKPGGYPFEAGMTVLGAVALAGGPTVTPADGLRIENDLIGVRNKLKALRRDHWTALALKARLIAERDGRQEIAFPASLTEHRSDPAVAEIIDTQTRIFQAGRASIDQQARNMRAQIAQLEAEVSARHARSALAAKNLRLIQDEIGGLKELYKKGYTSKSTLNDRRRKEIQLQSDSEMSALDLEKAKHDIEVLKLNLRNLATSRASDALSKLQDVDTQIAQLEGQRDLAVEQLGNLEVNAARTRAILKAQAKGVYYVTRDTGGGLTKIEATDHTLVLPGDIIEVPSSDAAMTVSKR